MKTTAPFLSKQMEKSVRVFPSVHPKQNWSTHTECTSFSQKTSAAGLAGDIFLTETKESWALALTVAESTFKEV